MDQDALDDQPAAHQRRRVQIAAARCQAEALDDAGTASIQNVIEVRCAPEEAPALPLRLEGYEVLREIHRGGQGAVYQAIQLSTRRKVAIKVLHEGPTPGSRGQARFEREVQILGQLHHPNIVAVHDSGMIQGRAYFVMDYVSGEQLDAYVVRHRLGVPDTVRLFGKVCTAINAAHLHGIIHRDIKPSNIRVDSAGEPHILDFGLAKVAVGEFTSEQAPQVMSATGEFIGSLPWSSPEQAGGRPDQIDMRTDVYSLGVVFYQLLTGRFPYDVTGRLHDVVNNILSAEPIRPRTRCPRVDEELETILLKALHKDRERRYQTAGELGRDVARYLSGEAIEAKRDSSWYLLRKAARRYAPQVAVGAAFVLLLAAFGAVMTVMYDHARAAERRSTAHALRAQTLADFLESTLTSIDPDVARGRDTTLLLSILQDAASRVDTELDVAPETRATTHHIIGRTYFGLGDYRRAEDHLQRAYRLRRDLLGEQDPETAEARVSLALALKQRGQYPEAERHYRAALSAQALALGEDSVEVAATRNGLAELLHVLHDLEQAATLHRAALRVRVERLGNNHIDTATSMSNLASTLRDRGGAENMIEAEQLMRTALTTRQQLLGAHPHTAVSLNRLGLLLLYGGRDLDEATALLRQALDMRRNLLPPDHPLIAVSVHNLGLALDAQGRYAPAETLLRQAVALWRAQLGPRHPNVAYGLRSLAGTLCTLERYDEAEQLAREALAIRWRIEPPDPVIVADAEYMLGRVLLARGDRPEAERMLRGSLRTHEEYLPDNPRTATVAGTLGRCLVEQGSLEEAKRLLLPAYAVLDRAHGPDHRATREVRAAVAALYTALEQPEEARRFTTQTIAVGVETEE